MVAGAGDQLVAADEVEAGVTAVRPVGRVALEDAGNQRGAGGVDQAFFAGVTQQLMVPGHDGILKEADRVGQGRAGVALEQRGHGLEGQLRGHLALGVATHAIGQRKQTGIPRVAVAHAVFVLFAAALAADLVNGEPHALVPVLRFSSCSFTRSAKVSLE